MAALHECYFGAAHVDLPDVQLLVVVDAFVHLVRFEALRRAAVHDVSDLDGLAGAGQLAHDGKDAIRSVWHAARVWEKK